MTDRRSLIEGLKNTPSPAESSREKEFVYGGKAVEPSPTVAPTAPTPHKPAPARVPISTRMRADFAAALKRASLERQLSGVEPNTLQDILEEAIQPWLKAHQYL